MGGLWAIEPSRLLPTFPPILCPRAWQRPVSRYSDPRGSQRERETNWWQREAGAERFEGQDRRLQGSPRLSIQQTQPRLCQSLVRSLKPNQGFDSPCVKEAWILGWGLKGSLPSIQDGREQSSFGFLVVDLDFDILHL